MPQLFILSRLSAGYLSSRIVFSSTSSSSIRNSTGSLLLKGASLLTFLCSPFCAANSIYPNHVSTNHNPSLPSFAAPTSLSLQPAHPSRFRAQRRQANSSNHSPIHQTLPPSPPCPSSSRRRHASSRRQLHQGRIQETQRHRQSIANRRVFELVEDVPGSVGGAARCTWWF